MPSSHLICRAPLIWLLAPLLGGYLIGYHCLEVAPLLLVLAGMACALCALLFGSIAKRWARWSWTLLFLIAGTLLAWSYFLIRWHPPTADWKALPPREVEGILEIRRTFQSSKPTKRISGIARVHAISPHLRELEGQEIYFQLQPLEGHLEPVRTALLEGRGILSYLDKDAPANDFANYLRHRGVHFTLRRGRFTEAVKEANPFYRFCARQNAFFQTILQRGAGDESNPFAKVYTAMLLGKKSILPPAQKEVFLKSGTMHFFAISGLHVAAMALTLHYFFMLLRLPSKLGAILALALLFLYVEITGAAPSAVRAFLMVAFYWNAKVLWRQASPFAALMASAIAVLLWQPTQLWSAGFQLSYAVVGSILLYGLPLIDTLKERLTPFRDLPPSSLQRHHRALTFATHRGIELFSISFAATLISTPLTIHYFQIFTPGAIFLNMVLVSLAGLLIVCGSASLFFGILHLGWMSAFFNHGAWVILWTTDTVITSFLKLPGVFQKLTYHNSYEGPLLLLLLLSTMLVAHARKRVQTYLAFCLPPLILLAVILFTTHPVT